MPPKPIQIVRTKLLLVEGEDAYRFWIPAYEAFGADIQVLNFGGVSDLTAFLRQLKLLDRYDEVETLVIARDAEQDPNAAISSIKNSLDQAALPVPAAPFAFEGAAPRTAYMLHCGHLTDADGNFQLQPGTLEDLCLSIVAHDAILSCVDDYIACVTAKGETITWLHKAKLYSYLSGKSKFVGMKLGEAARAGAWDWTHQAFEPYMRIITSM